MLKASDIMTTEVITVKRDTSLKDVARILYEKHINGLPVVDEKGMLIGIICENDLIQRDRKLQLPAMVAIFDTVFYIQSSKKLEKEFQRFNATTVEDLYTKDVVTVDKDSPVEDIATVMTKKKIYTIPVMDGDKLVGVIGQADLIRTIIN